MKDFLLLLALAGVCCGFQAPLHYKYKYFGSVGTGIPELSGQAKGWAMKADVEVFLEKNNGIAIFQLHHVIMAEFDEDLGCDARQDVPDQLFHPFEDVGLNDALETPFKVNLFHHKDFAIEDSGDKFQWLTNMRKGIASIFKTEILRGNVENQLEKTVAASFHKGHVHNVFSLQEETIFGLCKVEYTIYPVPEHLAGTRNHELKKRMERDDQREETQGSANLKKTSKKSSKKGSRGKSSKRPSKYRSKVPQLKDNLWHVVRSVNFDHCDEKVALQIIPVGIHGDLTAGQYEWSRGRSSVSEYIFRGSPGHLRLESATVEGATMSSPLGFKTELLQSRVNQTLQLVSVTSKGEVPAMPSDVKHSKTWMHELYSFAPPPKISKPYPWVVYNEKGQESVHYFVSLGINRPSPEQLTEAKARIVDDVKYVSKILTDLDQEEKQPPVGEMVDYLERSAILFKSLGEADILKIFEDIYAKNLHHHDILAQKLIVDAAAASGTYYANKAILNYIKNDRLSTLQIMTYFMSITNNAECPSNIPEMMDYVLSLDIQEKPFLTSTVLVNFANFLNHMCIDPRAREMHYVGPLFGDYNCDKRKVKEEFLPYLKNIIYHKNTTWEKDVAVQALHILGTPFSFPILADVIEGKIKCSSRLRASAIYALDRFKLSIFGHMREQIIDLLTDVYSDIGEEAEVREAALVSTVFWEPEPSFWYRLARTSWREPSKNFATYMTSLIESFSNIENDLFKKQIQAASFALKLAKPVAPSEKYSYIIQMTSKLVDRHVYKYSVLAGHNYMRSTRSFGVYFLMMSNLGGFEVSEIEFFASALTNPNLPLSSEKPGFKGIPERIARDFYSRIEDTIKTKIQKFDGGVYQADIFLRILGHMSVYFPVNLKTIKTTILGDATQLAILAAQFSMGYDLVLGKFFTPINIRSILPTELGIPMFVGAKVSFLYTDMSYTNLDSGNALRNEFLGKIKISAEELSRLTWVGNSYMTVLLPWDEKNVGAGFRGARELTLPFNVVLRNDAKEKPNHPVSGHLDIQSLYKRKFRVASGSNTPYTGAGSMIPLEFPWVRRVITNTQLKTEKIPLPDKYTGLDLSINWESETEFPLNLWNMKNLISHPEMCGLGTPWLLYSNGIPTVKHWIASLEFDPESSQTKNVSFEFTFGTYGKEREEATQFTQESNGWGQYDQDAVGQYDQEEQSVDVDHGFQEIGGSAEVEITQYIHYNDSKTQRGEKLQTLFGGPANVFSVKVNLEGNQHRSYEIAYSYSRSKLRDERKLQKSQISLIRSPISQNDESSSLCLDIQQLSPVFSKLDTIDSLFYMNLDKDIQAGLTLGCKGSPVLTLTGTYHLSEEWKLKLQKEVLEACDSDSYNPLYTFHSHAVYDEIKYILNWEKVCDSQNYPITAKLMGIAEHLLDASLITDSCNTLERERKVEIDARRCPISGNWFFDGKREGSERNLNGVPHNEFFNFAFSIGKRSFENYPDHLTKFNLESEQCVLGINSVRTFDGFTYEYSPTQCWTVAAKECFKKNGKMLLIRSPSTESTLPDAKYVDVEKGLVIEYVNHQIKVNGKVKVVAGEQEVIRNDDGEVLFKIYKKNDFYMVQFSDDFFISAKDKIRIHVPDNYQSFVCGLCGDYDGEPESELVGPHRCFYENPNLFVASWSAGSETCDLYTLLELRENVETFQNTCHTIESLRESCPDFNDRCFKFGWMVRKITAKLCVSSFPLPYCEEGCNWHVSHHEMVDFNCWPTENAPNVIKEALEKEEVYTTTPIVEEHYFHEQVYLSLPTECKKY